MRLGLRKDRQSKGGGLANGRRWSTKRDCGGPSAGATARTTRVQPRSRPCSWSAAGDGGPPETGHQPAHSQGRPPSSSWPSGPVADEPAPSLCGCPSCVPCASCPTGSACWRAWWPAVVPAWPAWCWHAKAAVPGAVAGKTSTAATATTTRHLVRVAAPAIGGRLARLFAVTRTAGTRLRDTACRTTLRSDAPSPCRIPPSALADRQMDCTNAPLSSACSASSWRLERSRVGVAEQRLGGCPFFRQSIRLRRGTTLRTPCLPRQPRCAGQHGLRVRADAPRALRPWGNPRWRPAGSTTVPLVRIAEPQTLRIAPLRPT